MMKYLLLAAILLGSSSVAFGQNRTDENAKPTVDDIPLLIDALVHQDQQIRIRAKNALVEIGDASVPALIDKVENSGILRATSATIVLDQMGDRAISASPRIMAILNDSNAKQWRWFIASVLLSRIDPASKTKALPMFIAALKQSQPMKQLGAIHSVLTMGQEAATALPALKELLQKKRSPFAGVLISDQVLADNMVAYTQAIPAYDDLLILNAMQQVGASEKELLPALTFHARHDSHSVQLMAARQLSRLDTEAKKVAAETLVSLLSEERLDIRESAAEILGTLGPDAVNSVSALIALLEQGKDDVRRLAAISLGEIGPDAKSAVPALKKAIRLEKLLDTNIQEVMAEAIKKIMTPAKIGPKTAAVQLPLPESI